MNYLSILIMTPTFVILITWSNTIMHYPNIIVPYSVKRSDVTGNRFEWELGENKAV